MNHITLIGNLVRDAETRVTPKGISHCQFTIAVDRKFKVDGEKVTDYFRINTWRQLADICKGLSKGKKVAIVGELQASLYESKDGQTKMSLDVQADSVEFLSPKERSENGIKEKPVEYEDGFTDVSSDDIPF